jgi:hypothetical protein
MSKLCLSKFKGVCPRELDSLPTDPCPLALECINSVKAEGVDKKKVKETEPTSGCPWFVASADYNYCFWSFYQDMDEAVPEKTINDLLLINKPTQEFIVKTAVDKLILQKDSSEMQEFKETVLDISSSQAPDYTAYMPSEFRESLHKDSIANQEGEEEKPKKVKKQKMKKHPTGLPLHRSGLRVDLWGLSNKKPKPSAVKPDSKNAKKTKKPQD